MLKILSTDNPINMDKTFEYIAPRVPRIRNNSIVSFITLVLIKNSDGEKATLLFIYITIRILTTKTENKYPSIPRKLLKIKNPAINPTVVINRFIIWNKASIPVFPIPTRKT